MEIDIRKVEDTEVTRIVFADYSGGRCFPGATYITKDSDGDICSDVRYIDPKNLDNYIKAIIKAKELGWGK